MDIKKLITDIEAYAEKYGRTPEYVCRKATGNPRLFERLQNRLEQTVIDGKRIRQSMAEAERNAQKKPAPKAKQSQHIKKIIPQKVQS